MVGAGEDGRSGTVGGEEVGIEGETVEAGVETEAGWGMEEGGVGKVEEEGREVEGEGTGDVEGEKEGLEIEEGNGKGKQLTINIYNIINGLIQNLVLMWCKIITIKKQNYSFIYLFTKLKTKFIYFLLFWIIWKINYLSGWMIDWLIDWLIDLKWDHL